MKYNNHSETRRIKINEYFREVASGFNKNFGHDDTEELLICIIHIIINKDDTK